MSHDTLTRLNRALTGRYAIHREIGRGGAATVYLAEDLKHQRSVALKLLRDDFTAACGTERCLNEIAIVAKLSHPNILPLYDSAEVDGTLFYTMPYVKGGSLRDRLERERRLPIAAAVDMARAVAGALAHAHAHGLIHRDVKPENILLYEGLAMVADFGIALALDTADTRRLTDAGLAIGTAAYMSPEQAAADRVLDARSDVYSLACVLYEALTGELPHRGASPIALLAARLHGDPTPARRLREEIPDALEGVLMRALERDPDLRWPTAADFATALGEAMAGPAARPPKRRSVAVLPFLNIGADPENEVFAEGVSEDVIAHLAKIRDLEVISRSSSARFGGRDRNLREIGARLHVATVLEGSVRRAGNRVRIVAQLVDCESDKHLWVETYDRDLTDIFAIQTDVALQIAAALRAELTSTERDRIQRGPTRNLDAYEHYVRGRRSFVQFTPTSMREAAAHFEAAVAADPTFALGHVGVATAYTELVEVGAMPAAEGHPLARAAVERALALDEELGDAHAALAHLHFVADHAFGEAERRFIRALELSPGSADTHDHYGRMLSSLGRFEEAHAHIRRAIELDPLSAPVDLATVLLRMGRHDEALTLIQRQVATEPRNARARATLGWARFLKGEREEGIAELERAVACSPDDSTWIGQLGQAYGSAGRADDARAALQRLDALARERYVSPYHRAYVHVGLGAFDAAMDLLEEAYELGGGSLYGIKTSFLFAPLRTHPRFVALTRKLNLP
jgi:serine/threonine protein kinase/tetratricopeptide (TPR) repeat protein